MLKNVAHYTGAMFCNFMRMYERLVVPQLLQVKRDDDYDDDDDDNDDDDDDDDDDNDGSGDDDSGDDNRFCMHGF